MKALVVYYSRTGITKSVAEAISKSLNCHSEEIVDMKNRSGMMGYIVAGKDATLKKLTEIKNPKKAIAMYDLVVIGTPVWAGKLTPAIRTYLKANKAHFKKVAFFGTHGGSGAKTVFKEIAKLTGKKPLAELEIKTKDVVMDKHMPLIAAFVSKLI